MNSRITWTLAFQGFLFLSSAKLLSTNTMSSNLRRFAVGAIGIAGCLVAISTLLGVSAAYASIKRLKVHWRGVVKKCPTEAPWFSTPFGDEEQHLLGLLPSYGVPLAVVVGWVGMLVVAARS